MSGLVWQVSHRRLLLRATVSRYIELHFQRYADHHSKTVGLGFAQSEDLVFAVDLLEPFTTINKSNTGTLWRAAIAQFQTGAVISSEQEDGFTIDSRAHASSGLGALMTIEINGVADVLHTGGVVPLWSDQPAPLEEPLGVPSSNWLLLDFESN